MRDHDHFNALKPFNILPPFYRQFYHFCCFTLIILKNTNLDLNKTLLNYKTIRNNYSQPLTETNFMKNSFIIISIKTLNLFLDKLYFDSIISRCNFDTLKKALRDRIECKYLNFCKILYGDEFEHKFLM